MTESKTFVERLTDEQVERFVSRIFPNYKKYCNNIEREKYHVYLHGMFEDDWYNFGITLYDFDTSGEIKYSDWAKFLMEIFGEEYKKAYLEKCSKDFDKMIANARH